MSRLNIVLTSLILVLACTSLVFGSNKKQVRLNKIDSPVTGNRTEVRVNSDSTTPEPCLVIPIDTVVWRVDGWVTGNELYKNFLDPAKSCEDPYPFTITEVNMPMYFAGSTLVYVSVDIEDVYYAAPGCPWPDSVLALSMDYIVTIPAEGYYDLWIPLDEPVAVNGPFFAGFFIGNAMDSAVGAAVLTDDNNTAKCQSYNIWDEQIGFIELVANGLLNFPGQLLLYAAGFPGGGDRPVEPEPAISILSPVNGSNLLRQENIWAHETSGSGIIDHVVFEYSKGDKFIEIGRDFDGTSTVRDAKNPSDHGDGFNRIWDFSTLAESDYNLRVTAYDTLGRSASDEISVHVEPTPPTPKIIRPDNASEFCSSTGILLSCPDENLKAVSFFTKPAEEYYSAGIKPLSQSPYGDHFGAPVAAAMAVRMWIERGYPSLLHSIADDKSDDALIRELADRFHTADDSGTTDENLYAGLKTFDSRNGNALRVETASRPDYFTIRILAEEQQRAVLLGLGGASAGWLTVDGFEGWQQPDGSYRIAVCNPSTGNIEIYPIRDYRQNAEIYLNDAWHPVERIVSLVPHDWKVKRELLGTDREEYDAWSFDWTPDDLPSGSWHFIRAEAVDADGIEAAHTILVKHNCSGVFAAGDYDGNQTADIVDLAYLIEYITRTGPEPEGGAWRADANGDSHVNITDIVYYMNHLYGAADPPKH